MLTQIKGLHHVTSMAADAQENNDFFTKTLGLRRVKKTVNFDAPDVYHLYYGDEVGNAGSVMTYFPFANMGKGGRGAGEISETVFSVPKGVIEAARSIGLTRLQTNVSVVAPIMLRNALPSLGNTFIWMFKDSSIAAAIAVPELTFEARKINVDTFRVIETWMVASGLYIAACVVIAALLRGLERRFPKF